MFTYWTRGTCSRQILFEVTPENTLHNVRFIGGCSGNLQGIARLVEGKDIDEVEQLLSGILCKSGTSCPDQLSRAIGAYKQSLKSADQNNEESSEKVRV